LTVAVATGWKGPSDPGYEKLIGAAVVLGIISLFGFIPIIIKGVKKLIQGIREFLNKL
jgi:hypothetical protein